MTTDRQIESGGAAAADRIAGGAVARLLAREARMLGRAGDERDAGDAAALARLLRDPRRLAAALSDDRDLVPA